jgi:8-oxo-dGTP diphosphatase
LCLTGCILLTHRAASGYQDGELSLRAGHIDGGDDVKTALVPETADELPSPVSST